MLTVTTAQLNAWLVLFLWPFARILALVAVAPITGNAQFPTIAKIGFALVLTVLVAPGLPLPAVDPGSGAGLLLLARETALGIAMGLAMRVVFAGVATAGDVIGLQMGLGFAQFYDAQSGGQTPVVGQFLGLLASLTFLSLNGHLVMLATLIDSFRAVPVEAAPGQWLALAEAGGMVMRAALLLSLPLIATLLVVNTALGVLARAAPQLNIFAIGFPVTLIAGFVALMLALPYCVPAFEQIFGWGLETMARVALPPR